METSILLHKGCIWPLIDRNKEVFAPLWYYAAKIFTVNDVSMKPIGPIFGLILCPETTVTNYQATLRNIEK